MNLINQLLILLHLKRTPVQKHEKVIRVFTSMTDKMNAINDEIKAINTEHLKQISLRQLEVQTNETIVSRNNKIANKIKNLLED